MAPLKSGKVSCSLPDDDMCLTKEGYVPRDLFTQMMSRPNRTHLREAVWALEKLTNRELEVLPEDTVTVLAADAPLLKEGEYVRFHFGGMPEMGDFREGEVVIEIATTLEGLPACRVALHRVIHDHGETFHPLRARIEGVPVGEMIDIGSDSALYRLLCRRDGRAAIVFSHMWRLQMGPVIVTDDDQICGQIPRRILGAVYS